MTVGIGDAIAARSAQEMDFQVPGDGKNPRISGRALSKHFGMNLAPHLIVSPPVYMTAVRPLMRW